VTQDPLTIVRTRLDSGRLDLPVLPAAALAVMQACGAPETNARDIAEVLRRDPALAAHFLRISNSPLFSPRTPIVSLPQAVARLGTSLVRQVAMLVATRTRRFVSARREPQAQALSRHAVLRGLWAQEIARLKRLNVEEAFLGGLLQEVGVPVLWQLVDELGVGDGASEVERELLPYHDRVGAAVVRHWGLSERLAEIISRHHEELPPKLLGSSGAGAPTEATIAAVQLAGVLAERMASCDAIDTPITHPAMSALDLYEDDLAVIEESSAAIALTLELLP
jgi:HD-like signal output (HDOD) protein